MLVLLRSTHVAPSLLLLAPLRRGTGLDVSSVLVRGELAKRCFCTASPCAHLLPYGRLMLVRARQLPDEASCSTRGMTESQCESTVISLQSLLPPNQSTTLCVSESLKTWENVPRSSPDRLHYENAAVVRVLALGRLDNDGLRASPAEGAAGPLTREQQPATRKRILRAWPRRERLRPGCDRSCDQRGIARSVLGACETPDARALSRWSRRA
jgi:hypothetical protein